MTATVPRRALPRPAAPRPPGDRRPRLSTLAVIIADSIVPPLTSVRFSGPAPAGGPARPVFDLDRPRARAGPVVRSVVRPHPGGRVHVAPRTGRTRPVLDPHADPDGARVSGLRQVRHCLVRVAGR